MPASESSNIRRNERQTDRQTDTQTEDVKTELQNSHCMFHCERSSFRPHWSIGLLIVSPNRLNACYPILQPSLPRRILRRASSKLQETMDAAVDAAEKYAAEDDKLNHYYTPEERCMSYALTGGSL